MERQLLLPVLLAQVLAPLRVLTSPLSEAWRRPHRVRDLLLSGLVPIAGGSPDVSLFPLGRHIYEEQYIDPASRAPGTVNGAGINLRSGVPRDCDNFRFIVLVGATDGTTDFKVQDSADDVTYLDLKDADAANVAITQFAATDDNKFSALEVTVRGYTVRQYIRGVLTVTGGLATLGAVFLQGYRYEGETPVPASADRKELKVPAVAT